MIRGPLTLITGASLILFPWPLTLCLALVTSVYEPVVPLAIGLMADTLYSAPFSGILPLYTLYGGAITVLALFVRSRLMFDTRLR